jgi:hypothetical protein
MLVLQRASQFPAGGLTNSQIEKELGDDHKLHQTVPLQIQGNVRHLLILSTKTIASGRIDGPDVIGRVKKRTIANTRMANAETAAIILTGRPSSERECQEDPQEPELGKNGENHVMSMQLFGYFTSTLHLS